MERLKKFSAALVAGGLALICLLVGILAVTALRPSQEVRATVTPNAPFAITRDGVFTLIGTSATVKATSTSGGPVSLALGTTTDIAGWLGEHAHTEIIGIAADRESLKVEEHAGAPFEAPADVSHILDSDMWLNSQTQSGSVTLDLADIGPGKSVIAASNAQSGDLNVEIVWQHPQTNVLAIASFILAGLLGVVALIFAAVVGLPEFLARRRGVQDETSFTVASDSDVSDEVTAEEILETVAEIDGDEDADMNAQSDEEFMEDGNDFVEDFNAEEETSDAQEATVFVEENVAEESSTDEVDADYAVVDHAVVDDTIATEEETVPFVPGRHGDDRLLDEDPPETVPTDTGIIDLTSVRPGAVFPSRRALREAREAGQERIVIEGHEFDTGLIPVVKLEEQPPSAQESANGGLLGKLVKGISKRMKGDR